MKGSIMNKTKLFNFKLEQHELDKLTSVCNKQGISKSRAVRYLVRAWLSAPKPKHIPKLD